jgi:ribosome biogenesis GTPase / thiamine phosphate phosphatase
LSNFSFGLKSLGWHPLFDAYFNEMVHTLSSRKDPLQDPSQHLLPARVMAAFQGLYRVAFLPSGSTDTSTYHASDHPPVFTEGLAELTGRFRHHTHNSLDYPAVGDWVLLEPGDVNTNARIHGVLPRRSAFTRTQAGTQHAAQVVAANVDTLFVVTSLNQDLNLRRLERYLTLAWESQAEPVILLNKAETHPHTNGEDVERLKEALAALESIALGCSVVPLSALYQQGLSQLSPWLKIGKTVALIGSSGVGKSTLLNALMGEEAMDTGGIREDDSKGKHTTTHREIFRLPQGALLMDTPGMRELRLHDSAEGLSQSFQDIEALIGQCRYRNCSHTADAGCALQAAVQAGILTEGRVSSYLKQHKENEWLARRADPVLQANAKQRWKKITQSHKLTQKTKREK